jgi:hypothetical protein
LLELARLFNNCGGLGIDGAKQTWKQFSKTAGGPTAFVADQKCCVKMADISEKLEKAGGKSRLRLKKFVSKSALGNT